MDRKNSRNDDKHKYSNEEKLALGENNHKRSNIARRMTTTFLNCYKTCK